MPGSGADWYRRYSQYIVGELLAGPGREVRRWGRDGIAAGPGPEAKVGSLWTGRACQ